MYVCIVIHMYIWSELPKATGYLYFMKSTLYFIHKFEKLNTALNVFYVFFSGEYKYYEIYSALVWVK